MRITELGWNWLRNSKLLWILVVYTLAIALGVAIGGFSVTRGVPLKPLLVGMGVLLGLVLLLRNRSMSIKVLLLQRTLLYLTIIAGFIGSAFLTIGVGPIHLFPYRVLLPLLWLFFAMGILLQGRLDLSHIKVKPYLQFLGLWLLYAILSLSWAAAKGDAIRHIIFLFMGVSIIIFVVYYFSNVRNLKGFYYLWLLILGVFIPIGLWENMTGHHLSVSGLIGAPMRYRFMPTGVYRNPNDFVTYLTLSIPFVLAFIRYRKAILQRILGIVALLFSLYLIIVAFSRANYLAVLLEGAFLFVFLLKMRGRLRAAVSIGIIILLLVGLLPNQAQRILQTVNIQLGSLSTLVLVSDGSVDVRINLLRNSLVFLVRTAGFGVGAGNAEYYMANFQVFDTHGITNPHNWWVNIWTDYGICIFLGYIVFYLALIIRLYEVYKSLDDKQEKMICEGLLVALIGFTLAVLSPSSITAVPFQWFLFAFALAFLNYQRLRKSRGIA